jgi:hypothetical protein
MGQLNSTCTAPPLSLKKCLRMSAHAPRPYIATPSTMFSASSPENRALALSARRQGWTPTLFTSGYYRAVETRFS